MGRPRLPLQTLSTFFAHCAWACTNSVHHVFMEGYGMTPTFKALHPDLAKTALLCQAFPASTNSAG